MPTGFKGIRPGACLFPSKVIALAQLRMVLVQHPRTISLTIIAVLLCDVCAKLSRDVRHR